MARIEEVKQGKTFKPYAIVVETQEEHDFLHGVFNALVEEHKEDFDNYNDKINNIFLDLVNSKD